MGCVFLAISFLRSNDGFFFDALEGMGQHTHGLLLQVVTTAQFGKPSNDEMANLAELWVARN